MPECHFRAAAQIPKSGEGKPVFFVFFNLAQFLPYFTLLDKLWCLKQVLLIRG